MKQPQKKNTLPHESSCWEVSHGFRVKPSHSFGA